MVVKLKGAGRRRLVERRDSLLLAVHDCPQPELARAALEQLVAELSRVPGEYEPGEPGVSSISDVETDPRGHWVMIDAGDLPNRVVGGLAERLRDLLVEAGVEQALVEVPRSTRLLEKLLKLGPGVVLHLLTEPTGSKPPVPAAWGDPLMQWLGPVEQMESLRAVVLDIDIEVDLGAARSFLLPREPSRTPREVLGRMPDGSVRYSRTMSHLCGLASFGVAGISREALLEREVPRLRQLALELAAEQVTYGLIEFTPTYQSDFEEPDDGRPPRSSHVYLIDEVAVDAFPFQVLGPGHLSRLGPVPELRPLAGGRASLDIGTFDEWLGERRDERREQGRRLLAPLLPDDDELHRRGRARLDARFGTDSDLA